MDRRLYRYGARASVGAGIARQAAIVNTSEMSDALRKQGLEPSTSTPEEFGAFIRNEVAQNIRIARAAGIAVE